MPMAPTTVRSPPHRPLTAHRTGAGRPAHRSHEPSWPQEHLDRVAIVHRAVGVGGLVERELEVEDLAGVDLAVPYEVDQLGQEAADRGGSTVDAGEAPEEIQAVDGDAVRDADEADMSAGARGMDGLHHRLLGADGLEDGVRTEPAR